MASSTIKLEVAAHSLFSALQAQKGGADRIELCMALPTGGLTPSAGMIRTIRDKLSIPIHVLIRPKLGGFEYSPPEVESMVDSISFCKSVGIEGVVIGCLKDGQINLDQMQVLVAAANNMDLTFHRAFDLLHDPYAGLEELIKLGFNRILTSGLAGTAWEGRDTLKKLCTQADGRLTIMPGAGINSKNIISLLKATGCQEFHASAKQVIIEKESDPLQITTISGQPTPHYETDWQEVAALCKELENHED